MPSSQDTFHNDLWHGTTILTVRKGGVVAIGGDGEGGPYGRGRPWEGQG